ncbi:precorrin-3B synthase [Rhizobium leucaenae]|uniref:Precorrin-3B synthase n=2 Tax=Rhizobium leucaenae TaxID=29450 RepID=A0A7W6ZR53_9HYPH|nr:precorrin-3B synthase [Rhizobium leucaenae]MBB4567218.1 precorrin-3B synthase [Rhizobium leucaenae]MBB6304303.1 precorrin-3B synthase [Rhizobium leucaenae]
MAMADRQIIEEHDISLRGDVDAAACVSNVPSMARGACPSLSAPMITGDGLLVRLHPTTPGLTIGQFRSLAQAAERHGNGLIEITARGNLQLRGMTAQSMPGLAADTADAGIIPETGVTIEVPPLSGLDPAEITDARNLAALLRQQIAALDPQLELAPKLTIVIDGGGRLNLDAITADIRLKAARTAGNLTTWVLAIGGTAQTAKVLASLSAEQSISAVIELLKALAVFGPRARGRDLDVGSLRTHYQSPDVSALDIADQYVSPIGIHPLGGDRLSLGLRPSFGQIHARDILNFLAIAEDAGAHEIRSAPEHAMLVLGLGFEAAKAVQSAAADYGFRTRADDPSNHVDVCAGAGACASAFYATKAAAADLLDLAPELLDGSLTIHLSGCRKGCAHPANSAITIVGAPMGYGVVVNGSASSEPVAYIGKEELKFALAEINSLVRNNKVAGESTKECLTRLGTDAIVTALRQG